MTAGRGGRREGDRRDGEQQGDLAARQRKAASGTAADPGSARWPASIAAKGAPPAARRGGGHSGGRGRAARPPSVREPAAREPGAREPARGDSAGLERGDREPAGREPAARDAVGRDQDPAAARPDREQAGRGQERDEAAAGPHAEAFRLPPQSERIRARAEELGRAMSGDPAGNDFWDRVSEEFAESGSQDPVRPAWSATAGPRAMGTGSAARRAPGEAGDELEETGPAGFRQFERAPRDRDATPRPSGPPDEEHDRDEQPGGAGAGPRLDRVVPPYVDDLARRGRQQREPEREPEREPAGADEPEDDAAGAGATGGPAASSAWSAWSSARARDRGPGADAGEARHDSTDHDAAGDERASMQATAVAAADTGTDAAGETGGHEAEAGVPGDDAADETTGHADPGGAAGPSPGGEAPGDAERPGDADDLGEKAGGTAEAQSAAEPGSARDAPAASEAAAGDDAGDAGKPDGGAGADGSTAPDDEVTVVPGVARYHRRGCILIRFLSDGDLETTTRRESEAAGSVPCKACQPDKPASAD